MDTQEVVEAVFPVNEVVADPLSASCNAPEPKSKTPAVSPTQEEINAEALAIAKRLLQRHAKTWKELEKY